MKVPTYILNSFAIHSRTNLSSCHPARRALLHVPISHLEVSVMAMPSPAALQRAKGSLWPFGTLDLLRELRVTRGLSGIGAGILPEFLGLGGNALLYSGMEETLREFRFEWYELTQVAETAVQMRRDLETLGGEPYKNHRIYGKSL